MAAKNRKIRKKRGSRTCGRGSHKNSRNAGSRGGRGFAGTHKSKWTWIIKNDPGHFGDRGFDLPKEIKHTYDAINIGELDEIAEKIAESEEGGLVVDVTKLECEKVLGKGKITRPLIVKALSFSKSAIKKIEASGGKAVVL